MTSTVLLRHVFISVPPGLEPEREQARAAVEEFNRTFASRRGILFELVGGEELLAATADPRELIRATIRSCDFFVLLLGDRWGSPGESGTEEELTVAMQCLAASSMQQLVVLFKRPPAASSAHPDPQLARVLGLKERIERQSQCRCGTFDTPDELQRLLLGHLAAWLQQTG